MFVLPRLHGDTAARLREALLRAGYSTAGTVALLGETAHDAMNRGEPVPARRASVDGGALGLLVRLFLLGDPAPADALGPVLAPLGIDEAVDCGLLRSAGHEGLRAALDVRPHADRHGDWWVVSDTEAGWLDQLPGTDTVPGIGAASVSLIRATTRRPVDTFADIGTGCGVQILHAARHADRVVGTDVSARALAMARATADLNGLGVELLAGEWFEPVAQRRFDEIVSNPPFVVGPARVEYTYRDSGLAGDAGTERMLRQLPAHLTDGGVGHVLGSWLHRRGGDWAQRVAEWLPETGVDAWIVQRDVSEPARYVGTWLADSGINARSPYGQQRAEAWLDWFAAHDVEAIGSGFVTIRRTGTRRSTIVCEDLRHAFDDPLGPEAADWLDRAAWLRCHDDTALLATPLTLAGDVRLDRRARPGEQGWEQVAASVVRTGGPGWRHEIDERAGALLAGCTGVMPVGELIGLLAVAHQQPADEIIDSALPVLRELIQHGLLLAPEMPRG